MASMVSGVAASGQISQMPRPRHSCRENPQETSAARLR